MKPAAIIFDFDGVIADSDVVSARAFSQALTAVGLPTTPDEAADRYTGLNRADTLEAIAAHWGERTPPDIAQRLNDHMTHAFSLGIEPIMGVIDFIGTVSHLPLAIGSSSTSAYIRGLLGQFGLEHHFGPHVYSGREHVTRGKPHPDIYLHAASVLGVDPREALIIEDSPVDARAAVAAGAQVVGLCAGGHCRPGHDARLREVGVHHIASSYGDVARLLSFGVPD